MSDILTSAYPWVLSIHIMAVISWMAGIFYLPRLFVHHVESGGYKSPSHNLFVTMEQKLLKIIMNPAMIVTWVFGILLVLTPGVVAWDMAWPWVKAAGVITMTWFHIWLGVQRKRVASGTVSVSGRGFRIMNEVPTVLMIVIVLAVVVKF